MRWRLHYQRHGELLFSTARVKIERILSSFQQRNALNSLWARKTVICLLPCMFCMMHTRQDQNTRCIFKHFATQDRFLIICSNTCREAALLGCTIIATICLTLATCSNAFLCCCINLLKFLTSQRMAGASIPRERRRRVKKNRSPGNKCWMFYTISSPWKVEDKGGAGEDIISFERSNVTAFAFFDPLKHKKQSKTKGKASKRACDQSLTFCSKTSREFIKH